MKTMNLITVAALCLGMVACSDSQPVLSKTEANALSIKDFAVTACHSFLNANFEQLAITMEEKYLIELKAIHDKEEGSWGDLSDKITCTVNSQKTIKAFGFKSEMFKFNSKNGSVLNISITEIDGQKFVDGFHIDGFDS